MRLHQDACVTVLIRMIKYINGHVVIIIHVLLLLIFYNNKLIHENDSISLLYIWCVYFYLLGYMEFEERCIASSFLAVHNYAL